MELIKLRIPAAFITPRARMSWRELQFGLANELLDPRGIIDFAIQERARLDRPPRALLNLAGLSRSDQSRDLVDELATAELERTEAELRDKWLHLTLAWLYERRDHIADPLQAVEEVFSDFGYPEEIANFVRYMPMDGPDLGSREANDERLMERWRNYLGSTASRYQP